MVIQLIQLLFWGVHLRFAYARLDFWYWTGKLFERLAHAACDRAILANIEIDDLIEVLHQTDD